MRLPASSIAAFRLGAAALTLIAVATAVLVLVGRAVPASVLFSVLLIAVTVITAGAGVFGLSRVRPVAVRVGEPVRPRG